MYVQVHVVLIINLVEASCLFLISQEVVFIISLYFVCLCFCFVSLLVFVTVFPSLHVLLLCNGLYIYIHDFHVPVGQGFVQGPRKSPPTQTSHSNPL